LLDGWDAAGFDDDDDLVDDRVRCLRPVPTTSTSFSSSSEELKRLFFCLLVVMETVGRAEEEEDEGLAFDPTLSTKKRLDLLELLAETCAFDETSASLSLLSSNP